MSLVLRLADGCGGDGIDAAVDAGFAGEGVPGAREDGGGVVVPVGVGEVADIVGDDAREPAAFPRRR